MKYSFLGDFNVRTQSRQCTIFQMDRNPEMVIVDPLAIGITRTSKDQGVDATSFRHHLLELGSRHQMIIYNDLSKWPGSGELTCFPHGGGESTVDYLIGRPKATHMVNSFQVAPCPIGADIASYTLS